MTDELADYDAEALARHIYIQRKAGHSFPNIQQQMLDNGMPAPSLENLMKLHRGYQMKLAQLVGVDERQQMLALELERLDDLQAAIWPSAIAGDLQSVDRVLKVMAHRAKVTGLDQLSTNDKETLNTVLIVGGDQRAFLEALENGRNQIVAGDDLDDEDDKEAQ